MNRDEFKRFGAAYEATCAMYGDKFKPVAETIALAFHALKEYPLTEVLDAFGRHLRDPDRGQFAPKPADIVRQIELGTDTRAALAWDKVRTAAIRVGQYTSVVFDDPAIHAVVDGMGGWVRICEMETALVGQFEKQFVQRYRHYALNPPAQYPRALGGIGGAAGLTYIGDRIKAEAVHSGGGASGLRITHGPAREAVKAIATRAQEVSHATRP